MNPLYKRIGIVLVSVLLMCNIGNGQNNLSIQLTDSSVLLDKLVVCGDADFQRITIGIDGDNLSPRSTIIATLNLFEGIIFDSLDISDSSPGVSISPLSTDAKPVFILPDINPSTSKEVNIAFTVRATCGIVSAINSNNELQVLDNWQIDYNLEGNQLSETFMGVEYKNTLAVPNLSLDIEPTDLVSLNSPFQREVKIINSGLNSYLDNFTYRIIPESGIVFQSLHIENIELPISKTVNANGDTVVTAFLDNDYFFNNKIESGLLGNQNGRFEVDEIVTLTETMLLLDCGSENAFELNTSHQLVWGCNGTNCQEKTSSLGINLGIGEEQIQFETGEDSIPSSFCSEGITSVIVSNSGFEFNDGFGTIFDISTGIGFADGQHFSLVEQGYEITSLQIGEVLVFLPDSMTNLGMLALFQEDPDGEGGLTDADGDGYFDDLPVGEQFTLLANYQVNCTSSAEFNLENGCDNDFRSSFDAKIDYRNACGGANNQVFDNYFRSFNSGGTREICSDPDAFNNEDEFTLVYSGERRRSNFSFCDGSDEIRARVTLPEGISISPTTFLEQDSIVFSPMIEQMGEEWVIVFDGSNFSHNKDYNLNLIFSTQCAPIGFISFPFQIEYLCSECDCGQLWYCGVLEGTLIHKTGVPCEDVPCEVGIEVIAFDVERTTFGFTDKTFTTPIDPSVGRKDIALTCDSVKMTVNAVVGKRSLEDSLGLVITYGNADESTSNAQTFGFANGTITIIKMDGTISNCTLNSDQIEVDTTNSTKQIIVSLDACLEGDPLLEGDLLTFEGNFSINADAPIPTNTFKKIPDFRVKAFAVVDGQLYDDCESYGNLFRLAKLETRFSGPNNDTYPRGCESTTMVYSLDKSINANAMREFFGSEHRQAASIDRVSINYDPSFAKAFSDLSVDYRVQEGDWIPLPDFFQFSPGTYEADLNNAVSTITGANQLFQLRINAIPACASAFNSAMDNGSYQVATTLNYTDRFYANLIGDGTCAEEKSVVEDRAILYQEPPSFSLQGIATDVITTSEEVRWEIEYCNTSFNADANLTWIALETPNAGIEITAVEVIDQSGDSELLLLQEYGASNSNVFAFAPELLKNIAGNTKDDICNVFIISAVVNDCGANTVIARTGWNCTDFEELDWTPDLYPPCKEQGLELNISSSEPFLSADYLAETSVISGALCDTSIIDIVVRNEEGGCIFDVSSRITIPTATRLIPNSFEFAYPSTGEFEPVTTDPQLVLTDAIAGNTYEYPDFSQLHSFLHANGLQGFNVNAPDSSEFRLKYRLVTDCDFNDGTVNRYRFQGITSCGNASNVALAETPPFIFEINPNTSRKFAIEVVDQELIRSGQPSTVELSITNIGDNLSENDSLNISLPTNLEYIPNSTLALSFIEWDLEEPVIINNDSSLQLRYSLPSGLEKEEVVAISFQLMGNVIECDTGIEIDISTISSEIFFCDVSSENCFYNYTSTDSTSFVFACSSSSTCEEVNNFKADTLLIPSCQSFINFCLENLPLNSIENYQVIDNGNTVSLSAALTCQIQQTCIYSYGNIFNINTSFEVESWVVDGRTFQGTIATISDLVDSMNVWDPTGNWVLNESSIVIEGGHIGGEYTPINIFVPVTNVRSILGYDTRFTPIGISIPLTAGLHEISIIKQDGCRDSLSLLVNEQDCNECVPPIVKNVITEESGCNQSLGRAAISVVGDINDYVFEWSPDAGNAGATDNIRTDLFTGGYKVKITRANDPTCFVEQFLTIGNSDGPMSSLATTPATCSDINGTATLLPANFTYSWSDGTIASSRSNLRAGFHYVTLTDPSNPDCPNVRLVEIEETNELQASLIVEEYPNCNETNGAVSIEVTGGSGNYTFNFPSGSDRQNGLAPGIYQVEIIDRVSGCQLPYTFALESKVTDESITINEVLDISCIENRDGQIVFDIQYSDDFLLPADTVISNGVKEFENGNLPKGDYFIYVQDVTGCITASAPFSINAVEPLTINVVKAIDCDTTQFITIQVSDTSQVLSYNWADLPGSENEGNRTNIESGVYDLTIIDNQACTTTISVELQECCVLPIIDDALTINSACGQATGSVEILLEENIEDYTFSIDPSVGVVGDKPSLFQNLPAGGYVFTIAYKGDSLCSEELFILLEEDSLLNIINSQIRPATCGNSDGNVELSIVGNDADYLFIYNPNMGSVGTTPNIQENLPAGTYQVAIQLEGSEQCVQNIEVEVPEENGDDLGITANSTPASCLTNGKVEVVVNGAITDYSYVLSPPIGTIGDTPNQFNDLTAGEYVLEVSLNGSDNCAQTLAVTVPLNANDELVTNSIITPSSCISENGKIELELIANPEQFFYVFSPSLGVEGITPNIRENLPTGPYSVTISSILNETCSQVFDFEIMTIPSNQLVTNSNITATDCGENSGTATLLVEGDINDYNFEWPSGVAGAAPNIREGLAAGSYTITITAINNSECSELHDIIIATNPFGQIPSTSTTTGTDCGENNGTATILVAGDLIDYNFEWPSGVAGARPNIREGLAVGNYIVTITKSTNTDCIEEVQIEIPRGENPTSPVISDAIQNPSCGENNGNVIFNLVDNPSNYVFEWSPNIGVFGATQNIRNSLPGGDYQIVITDQRDTFCVTRVLVSLVNEEPSPVAITNPPTCNTSTNGSARLSPEDYRYSWPDGFVGAQRSDLAAGNYVITVTDTTATDLCESRLTVELVARDSLTASIAINQQPTCADNDGSATISVTNGSGGYSFSWGNVGATNPNLSSGPQAVTVTDNVSGCQAFLEFELEDPNAMGTCSDCSINVAKDTIVLPLDNCISVLPYCLDYPLNRNNPLSVSLNGAPLAIAGLTPCGTDTLIVYSYSTIAGQGNIGPFQLTAWQVNGDTFTGEFNSIEELVTLMNSLDPSSNWQISQDGLSISGNKENSIYSPMQIIGNNSLFDTSLNFETAFQDQGIPLNIPVGIHELVVRDTQQFCTDSIVVIATCAMTDTTIIPIALGVSDTVCFSTEELVGDIVTTTIGCLQNETASVELYADTCVIITGLNSGIDTACIILCDEFGVCDTNVIAIQLLLEEFEDSISIGESQEVCLESNLLELDGRVVTINEIEMGGDSILNEIEYEIDPTTGCIRYTAVMLGIDTTSFAFCMDEGNCDTIPFIINVLNKPPDNIGDTLFINEMAEYCFDTSIFPGELVSFENICEGASNNSADFFLNPISFCVEYTGVNLGKDSACIVLCDNLGNCDTAFFSVQVVEFKELPTAVNDADTATINDFLVIDILSNDTPFGVPDDGISIVTDPLYGTATLNLDGSITYTSTDFCARTDELTYSICNDVGCDTATVSIWIACIDIVIFTAVSPNRDGDNDVFFISGIEEFTESRLQIYNRWGERVYQAKGYQNDWMGTWKNNLELPDGAYFYCLELNDEEERVFQGFLEIHR